MIEAEGIQASILCMEMAVQKPCVFSAMLLNALVQEQVQEHLQALTPEVQAPAGKGLLPAYLLMYRILCWR